MTTIPEGIDLQTLRDIPLHEVAMIVDSKQYIRRVPGGLIYCHYEPRIGQYISDCFVPFPESRYKE